MTQALFLALVLTIVLPFGAFLKGERTKKRFKSALLGNIATFFIVLFGGIVLAYTGNVSAAEVTTDAVVSSASGMAYLGAALSTGLSCIGAGIAISAAASSAIGALSENEALMGKALIFVALAEGVAIYGLVISIMILGRV